MNSRLYLKEIYRFQHGDDYFGLDVGNSLFFKMNKVTWDVIAAFPHYDKLTGLYDALQLKDAVDSLEKNKFITPSPQDRDTGQISAEAESIPVTGMGLRLQEMDGETSMPIQIIRHSIDLLMQESCENEECRLVLITDEFEKSLSAIEEAITYAREQEKKYNKKITIILNTAQFPLSPQCARFSVSHDLRLEIEITPDRCTGDIDKELNDGVARDLHRLLAPLFKKTIVALSLDSQVISSLNGILTNLDKIGFLMVYLDFLCPRCPGNGKGPGIDCQPVAPDSPTLKQYIYDLSANNDRNSLNVINIIPLIHTVMTSAKIRSGCRAGLNYIAVSAGGDIYPCHKAIANELFKLGSVFDGLDRARRERICFHGVDNKETCCNCGVRYLCGGGPTLDANGRNPTVCKTDKELAENAMFLYQQLDLKEKSRIIGVANRMKDIMPYRSEAAAPGKMSHDGMIRRLTVRGSSMRPFLKEGDRVVVQPTAGEKIKTGDIVCFGKPATCHRVIRKYKKKGRWLVLEKGDHQLKGSIVPLEGISGKVVSVQKGAHSFNLDTKRRAILNRLIAVLSALVHISSGIFNRSGRRKK